MKIIIKIIDISAAAVYIKLRQRREEDGAMSFADALLILVIAACVVLVVRRMIRNKKEGKSCCGCSGCSGSCHCSSEEPGSHS